MRGLLKLRRGLCALGVPEELPQGDLWGKPEMNCFPMPAASLLQLAGLWKGAKFGVVKWVSGPPRHLACSSCGEVALSVLVFKILS